MLRCSLTNAYTYVVTYAIVSRFGYLRAMNGRAHLDPQAGLEFLVEEALSFRNLKRYEVELKSKAIL